MIKISSLARMGIAHKCFGNPIPAAAYDLIDATEKCVVEFNPPQKIKLPSRINDIHLRSPQEVEDMYRSFMIGAVRAAGYEVDYGTERD